MRSTDEHFQTFRWWEAAPADRAEIAWNCFEHLSNTDRARQTNNLFHMRLYGNLAVEGTAPSTHNRAINTERLTLNVVANVCDTALARIGKTRPHPRPLTTAGNWSLRRKAKLLERFLSAQMDIAGVFEQGRRAFLDACVFGTGCLKIFPEDKGVCADRIFPSELLIDPAEAIYGAPRQIFQRKWVPRDVVRALFVDTHDKRSDIYRRALAAVEEATLERRDPALMPDPAVDDTITDHVLVVEAWRLPSAEGAGDGRHLIFTEAGPLLDEEWTYDYLPFVFFHWRPRLRGFWGMGIAESLCPIQTEINWVLQHIQKSHHRLGSALVFVDARSNVQKDAFTNDVGTFVHYIGNAPQVVTFDTVRPEIYQQLDRLNAKAYEQEGLGPSTAGPGVSSISGASADVQHEIVSERFVIQAQRFEEFYLQVANRLVDCAKAVAAANGGKYALPSERDKNTIESIPWKDVDMKADAFVLRIFPQSSLPHLPSTRLREVMTMMDAGLVGPQEGLELLDFPDTQAYLSLARAAKDNIERQIENILDEGIMEAPEPWMDLQLALKTGQQAMLQAMNQGCPEDRLQGLRDWLQLVGRMQQQAQVEQMKLAAAMAAQQGPAAPAAGAPPAPGPEGVAPGAVGGDTL